MTSAIIEPLHAPMRDVNNTAALLGLSRYEGETEDTWRTRVAYAMQAHVLTFEGKPVPERVKARMEMWEARAKEESQCLND